MQRNNRFFLKHSRLFCIISELTTARIIPSNKMISGRALHYVLKIGDRGANEHFFRRILGMKVFKEQ